MAAKTKTATGLPKNTAAALSVLLGGTLIVPVIFILIEKDSFVRFYSFQVLVISVLAIVLSPFTAGLPMVVGFILWLIMLVKAWQGVEWEVPLVGGWARKLAGSMK